MITGTRLSSYQLAQILDIRERQVEEHLAHVVKTVAATRPGDSFWIRHAVRTVALPSVPAAV